MTPCKEEDAAFVAWREKFVSLRSWAPRPMIFLAKNARSVRKNTPMARVI